MRSSLMDQETTELESPIDVMFLIHKTFRTEANRQSILVQQPDMSGILHSFRPAFTFWITALGYHAEQEDTYMTPPLGDSQMIRENQAGHVKLEENADAVLKCLNEEIGRTSYLIPQTRRHLVGHVMSLYIAQSDHLEEEEEFILPLVRAKLSETEQLQLVKHLLIDENGEDPRWIIDWVTKALTPGERKLLGDIESRFKELPGAAA